MLRDIVVNEHLNITLIIIIMSHWAYDTTQYVAIVVFKSEKIINLSLKVSDKIKNTEISCLHPLPVSLQVN